MNATYKHDCEACVFLGRHEGTDADLYIHLKGTKEPTLVVRLSDDGPDYVSVSPRAGRLHPLHQFRQFHQFPEGSPFRLAQELAVKKGLLSAEGEPQKISPPSELADIPPLLRDAGRAFDLVFSAVMKLGMEEVEVLKLVKRQISGQLSRHVESDRRLFQAFVTFIDECIEEPHDDS